jgi:hypothetical protein
MRLIKESAAILGLAALAMAGCGAVDESSPNPSGSSPIVVETKAEEGQVTVGEQFVALGEVTSLSVGASIEAVLVQAAEDADPGITFTGPADQLEKVKVTIDGGAVTIGRDGGWMEGSPSGVKAEIALADLDSIKELRATSSGLLSAAGLSLDELTAEASSSGRLMLENVTAQSAMAKAGSSGQLEWSGLSAENLIADVSSSATLIVNGEAATSKVEASSSGGFKGAFKTVSMEAAASSSGSIEAEISDSLTAKASSSGKVLFGGSPKVEKTESSGGQIRAR